MHGRHGQVGKRERNEIGYHAVRTGDNPGEHTIVFGMLGETIELRVAASNRDCYVQGAFAAAQFLQGNQQFVFYVRRPRTRLSEHGEMRERLSSVPFAEKRSRT